MALINTLRAWFWDNRGEYHGSKSFKKDNSTFDYAEGKYIIDLKASCKEEDVFPMGIWKRRTYFYNKGSSIPLNLALKEQPPITPEQFDIQMDTKVLRDLNDLAKGGFGDLFTLKNILLFAGAGLIAYLLLTGNLNQFLGINLGK